jgi:hypothetical protein
MFHFLKQVIFVSIGIMLLFAFAGLLKIWYPFLSKVIFYAIVIICVVYFGRSFYLWLQRRGFNR